MKAENVNRIMHANTSMIRAYSQDSLIWGERLTKYTIRFIVTIPSNIRGSISIYINDEFYRLCNMSQNFKALVNQGDKIKVNYSLRTSGYTFFSNIRGIEEGIVIDESHFISAGFRKLEGEIA